MTDHCACCGVKFDGETLGREDLTTENENHKWTKKKSHSCYGRICYWCACRLPGNLANVAVNIMASCFYVDKIYTIDNFKTFPNLSKRIEELGLIVQEDDSKWNCKCRVCGAKAYQGLMRVECSKGCK